jgi:Helix-turn-helix domain
MEDERPANAAGPRVFVKPVYSIPEFCEEFATCRSVAYEEIRSGRLKVFKNGASTRIAGEDAIAWRDAKRSRAA